MDEPLSGQILDPAMFEPTPDSGLAVQLYKGEIDMQISTARAYPRSLKEVKGAILTLATLDADTAAECQYALPRGKGVPVTGPSIRFAEIVKSQYGNCVAAGRIVHIDRKEKLIVAEGAFHDLEKNVMTRQMVQRRISTKEGKLFNDDMIAVTGNAAISIAIRNAILAAVPRALWRAAYDEAQKVMTGGTRTMVERRANVVKEFAFFGVKPETIFDSLGVKGLEDLDIDHLRILGGVIAGLRNGDVTVEEAFPPADVKDDKVQKAAGGLSTKEGRAEPEAKAETKVKKIDPYTHGLHHAQDGFERTAPGGVSEEELTRYHQGYDDGAKSMKDAPEKVEKPRTERAKITAPAEEAKATEKAADSPAKASEGDSGTETTDDAPGHAYSAGSYGAGAIDRLETVRDDPDALDKMLSAIFAEANWRVLSDMDEHLEILKLVKAFPAFERMDNGSLNRRRILNGY